MRQFYSLLLAPIYSLLVAGQEGRPNDLEFTPQQAAQSNCNDVCQQNLAVNIAVDREEIFGDVPFWYDFYETAPNFASSQPGDLLKLQRLNASMLEVPTGTSIYLIQYTSVGINGSNVPATAFVALPFTSPTGSNLTSLVAYSHGTIGTVAACAPSSSYNLYNYETWPILTVAGYAVVATDYAGLGNNFTTHKYVNPQLNSEDVYFSVVAARKAFPGRFKPQWAAVGHSQGGGAVWALTENPRVAASPNNPSGQFLGAVGLAPSPRAADLVAMSSQSGGYGPLIEQALEVVGSPIQPQLLTPQAKTRSKLIPGLNLCFAAALGLNADLPAYGANRDRGARNQTLAALTWLQETYGAAQGKKATGSLLVCQGTADLAVNKGASIKAMQAACNAGNRVQVSLYPGMDHDGVIPASSPEWLQWLDWQFRGIPSTRCVVNTRHPLESLQES
ncbi:hypothetical protein FE257_000765 [Aspergillus nanangensis]|uniref:Serine aminopeptidase S33 domain-containing protein n=1 Tax=Aspergillus nanangensis TaxID=2582783 RepID=A0AAD4CEN6_ASPNN|nr:hypothetical protein FE257_000765 [Aspergillus nanangensis]